MKTWAKVVGVIIASVVLGIVISVVILFVSASSEDYSRGGFIPQGISISVT